jgi:putative transposase
MTKPSSNLLWITEGATIANNDRSYVIIAVADINQVLAKDLETGQKVLLKIGDVGPPKMIGESNTVPAPAREILSITNEEWETARYRKSLIEPLLHSRSTYSEKLADEIALAAKVDRATIYRWVNQFRSSGLLSSLLPYYKARGGKGKTRIAPEVEAIIGDVIENFHNDLQHVSVTATIEEIRRRCFNAKLKLPAINTIRNRLKKTDGFERTKKRFGAAVAHDQHEVTKGQIPDADWPLAIVQIDHTLLPVIIVDDVYRKPINRAWITLAIDVYSRVCLGMHLSLDAPSALTAGMCIAHAILPKESWLAHLGMSHVEWSVWGAMTVIHADNAKEFRGTMIEKACEDLGIDIHFRPAGTPRYGGHIESMMGTVSEGLKALKGATFSGPKEKGVYDAEGNACMTFAELEQWLVLFFAKYHLKEHKGIGTSPLRRWSDGLLGTKSKPGRGLPGRTVDEESLRIKFTPFVERTVQNYGVVIDDIHYYHDVLRPWVNAPHPDFPKHKRNFRFHRDPRDISQLYFFDELSGRYVAIPYRDTSLPPVSIWELREGQRRAKERNVPLSNEKAVFELMNQQRELEESSAIKNKKARREQQRRTEHVKHREVKKKTMPSVSAPSSTISVAPTVAGYNPDEVQPLDDD